MPWQCAVTAQQETKVTKRSFEAPEPGKYGTSEYARIATASEGGIVSSVPQVQYYIHSNQFIVYTLRRST
jgi:hypothetical protein